MPGDDIDAALRAARETFLLDLDERCAQVEADILAVERGGVVEFERLFRNVHSLKGAAGMCQALSQAEICHHFEDFLGAVGAAFDDESTSCALKYLDLLRDSIDGGGSEHGGAYLRHRLLALSAQHKGPLSSRQSLRVLVIEPSAVCRSVCLSAISALPVVVEGYDNVLPAMTALARQRADMVVVARELSDLPINEFLHFLQSLDSALKPQRVVVLGSAKQQLTVGQMHYPVVARDRELKDFLLDNVRQLGQDRRPEAA